MIRTGIVHFGPGAFHRAHQADYVDRLLKDDPRWGIAAVSLRSPGTIEAMKRQRGRYTLAILDSETRFRTLAAHNRFSGRAKARGSGRCFATRRSASSRAPSPRKAIASPATAASISTIPTS